MMSRPIRHATVTVLLAVALSPLFRVAAVHADASGAWSELAPPAAWGAMLALDAGHGRLFAVVGALRGEIAPQIWVEPLGSPRWSRVQVRNTGPTPLGITDAFYDATADRLLLLGSTFQLWSLPLGDDADWVAVPTTGEPPPSGTAVYDARRGRILVVTSADPMEVFALDLAEGQGVWTKIATGGSLPPARTLPALAIEVARDRMVLCGGVALGDPQQVRPRFTDTWALDLAGGSWSLVTAGQELPSTPRLGTALLDDPAGMLLLLGPVGTGPVHAYRLEERNNYWAALTTPGVTPRITAARIAAASDTSAHRTIVFTPADDYLPTETWVLPAALYSSWEHLGPILYAPAPRSGAVAGYDPSSGGRMLLALGQGAYEPRNDAWGLSLGEEPLWSRIETDDEPLPVQGGVGGYDWAGGDLLVSGGADSLGFCALQSLRPDGRPDWSERVLNPAPTQRIFHAGVVLPGQEVMLIHGGAYRGALYQDGTWLYDSHHWRELHPTGTGPGPRLGHSAIHDPSRGRVIFYGGTGPSPGLFPLEPTVLYGDVWALSLRDTSWALLSADGPPRAYHSAVYDAVRDRMLVYGGVDSAYQSRSEVWAFALGTNTWSQVHPRDMAPTARDQHTALYDPRHDRMIVTGGGFQDTWSLDFGGTAAPLSNFTASGQLAAGGHIDFTGVVGSRAGAWQEHIVELVLDRRVGGAVDWIAPLAAGAVDTVRWTVPIPDSVDGDLQCAATAWIGRLPVLGDTLRFTVHVPVLVTSVRAATEPGRVALAWTLGDAGVRTATVYRRTAGGTWAVLARNVAAPAGSDEIAYEDAGVTPGLRYEYRLGMTSAGHEVARGVVAVEVPGGDALGLHRAWPNPARDVLTVAFTLPDASPATLELVDLAGRRVESRRVEALGVGTHRVSLESPRAHPPGLYFLRLSQGGRTRTARVCLVR